MPKMIMEFNLPEEQAEFETFTRTTDYHSCLWELKQFIRSKVKHHELTDEEEKLLEEIQELLNDHLVVEL